MSYIGKDDKILDNESIFDPKLKKDFCFLYKLDPQRPWPICDGGAREK